MLGMRSAVTSVSLSKNTIKPSQGKGNSMDVKERVREKYGAAALRVRLVEVPAVAQPPVRSIALIRLLQISMI